MQTETQETTGLWFDSPRPQQMIIGVWQNCERPPSVGDIVPVNISEVQECRVAAVHDDGSISVATTGERFKAEWDGNWCGWESIGWDN